MNDTITPTITSTTVKARLDQVTPSYGKQIAVVVIGAEQTAWNPTSTKNVIAGPATITYTRYLDGGIAVQVAGDDSLLCPHGYASWVGNECGLCDAEGIAPVNV